MVMQTPDDRHWRHLVSGRRGEDDLGWYHAIRRDLMPCLGGFVAAPLTGGSVGANVLLVTGPVGTGKTALLGTVVLGTEPALQGLRADVALDAADATSEALAAALLGALEEAQAPNVGDTDAVPRLAPAIADVARRRAAPLVIVIDSLERAVWPVPVLRQVVAPLAGLRDRYDAPVVRLVLGIRTPVTVSSETVPVKPAGSGAAKGDETEADLRSAARSLMPGAVIELSAYGPSETSDEDWVRYIAALLAWPPSSPYARNPVAAVKTAERLGDLLIPDFGLGAAVADALRRGDVQPDLTESENPAEPAWAPVRRAVSLERLIAEVVRIASHGAARADQIVAGLRASALAFGEGVPPGELWAAMTDAVLNEPGEAPSETAMLLDGLPYSGLAGHLSVFNGSEGLRYRVNDDVLDALLDEDPALVWAAIRERAPSLLTDAEPALLDPPDIVHERIARALVRGMLDDSTCEPDPPEPEVGLNSEPLEHHTMHWLRWLSKDESVAPGDRLDAARELARYGAEDDAARAVAAITADAGVAPDDRLRAAGELARYGAEDDAVRVMAAITAEGGADLRVRYGAAADLWRLGRRDEALAAYQMLAKVPGADRAAMIEAIRQLETEAEPPPAYRTPGIPIAPPPLAMGMMPPPGPIF